MAAWKAAPPCAPLGPTMSWQAEPRTRPRYYPKHGAPWLSPMSPPHPARGCASAEPWTLRASGDVAATAAPLAMRHPARPPDHSQDSQSAATERSGPGQGTNRPRHPHAPCCGRLSYPAARDSRQVRPRRSLRIRSTPRPLPPEMPQCRSTPADAFVVRSCAPVPKLYRHADLRHLGGLGGECRLPPLPLPCRQRDRQSAEGIRAMRRQPSRSWRRRDPAVTGPIPHPAPAPPDAGPPATPRPTRRSPALPRDSTGLSLILR